jgi:hypothetical protein
MIPSDLCHCTACLEARRDPLAIAAMHRAYAGTTRPGSSQAEALTGVRGPRDLSSGSISQNPLSFSFSSGLFAGIFAAAAIELIVGASIVYAIGHGMHHRAAAFAMCAIALICIGLSILARPRSGQADATLALGSIGSIMLPDNLVTMSVDVGADRTEIQYYRWDKRGNCFVGVE